MWDHKTVVRTVVLLSSGLLVMAMYSMRPGTPSLLLQPFTAFFYRPTSHTPTATIFIRHVRKPPDVAQPDSITQAGQDELYGTGPLTSLRVKTILGIWP